MLIEQVVEDPNVLYNGDTEEFEDIADYIVFDKAFNCRFEVFNDDLA